MMSMELTKDADKFLCVLYKEYLQRRKSGIPRRGCKYFSSEELKNLFPNDSFDDLMDYATELKKAFGVFIDIVGGLSLSDQAVIFMENRFPNGIASVLDWIAKITNVLPFP